MPAVAGDSVKRAHGREPWVEHRSCVDIEQKAHQTNQIKMIQIKSLIEKEDISETDTEECRRRTIKKPESDHQCENALSSKMPIHAIPTPSRQEREKAEKEFWIDEIALDRPRQQITPRLDSQQHPKANSKNCQAFGRCCGQECPRSLLVAAASALRCIADLQSAALSPYAARSSSALALPSETLRVTAMARPGRWRCQDGPFFPPCSDSTPESKA